MALLEAMLTIACSCLALLLVIGPDHAALRARGPGRLGPVDLHVLRGAIARRLQAAGGVQQHEPEPPATAPARIVTDARVPSYPLPVVSCATFAAKTTRPSRGDVSSSPCEVEAFYRERDQLHGPSVWSQLPGQKAGSGTASTALPVSWAVPIRGGDTDTFRVAVFLDGSPTGAQTEAALTATYVPFSGS